MARAPARSCLRRSWDSEITPDGRMILELRGAEAWSGRGVDSAALLTLGNAEVEAEGCRRPRRQPQAERGRWRPAAGAAASRRDPLHGRAAARSSRCWPSPSPSSRSPGAIVYTSDAPDLSRRRHRTVLGDRRAGRQCRRQHLRAAGTTRRPGPADQGHAAAEARIHCPQSAGRPNGGVAQGAHRAGQARIRVGPPCWWTTSTKISTTRPDGAPSWRCSRSSSADPSRTVMLVSQISPTGLSDSLRGSGAGGPVGRRASGGAGWSAPSRSSTGGAWRNHLTA